MEASICRDGRLHSLVNRKIPGVEQFAPLNLNRSQRVAVFHGARCRGRWDPLMGFQRWSKRNHGAVRREMARRLDETGRI